MLRPPTGLGKLGSDTGAFIRWKEQGALNINKLIEDKYLFLESKYHDSM